MQINARNATASDFDLKSKTSMTAFFGWLIISVIVWYLFSWWVIIPMAMSLWSLMASFNCSNFAKQLRNGSYKIPNPNNGAPDGDAKNINS